MSVSIVSWRTDRVIATAKHGTVKELIERRCKKLKPVSEALLMGIDLKGGDFRNGLFMNTKFWACDLTGAKFEGAQVQAASFARSVGVDLEGAMLDDWTVLPESELYEKVEA